MCFKLPKYPVIIFELLFHVEEILAESSHVHNHKDLYERSDSTLP